MIGDRDYLWIGSTKGSFLGRSSEIAAWRDPLIARYIQHLRRESTCEKQIIGKVCDTYNVRERTVRRVMESLAPST